MSTPVRPAAINPSRTTPITAEVTKTDWSPTSSTRRLGGRPALICGRMAFTPAMMSSVEADPDLRTVISTACVPSWCTMLVCGGDPSRTCATSRIVTTVPLTILTGRSSRSSNSLGASFRDTFHSKPPTFWVHTGVTRFCSASAATTSWADSPRAWSAWVSRSIWIWRTLPP